MNSAWELFGIDSEGSETSASRENNIFVASTTSTSIDGDSISPTPKPWYEMLQYTELDRSWDEAHVDTPISESPVWDDINQVWATGRTMGGMLTGGYWAKKIIIQGAGTMLNLTESWKSDEQRIAEGPQ